jgi:FtsH-binding integral membrane protein
VGDEIAAIQDSFRSDDQSPKTVFFSKAHSRHIFLAIAVTFYNRGVDFSATGSVIILFGLIVFIASHAFGQGAVIWVYLSEIFPNTVRARGQALGSFTHWIMAAVISWTFPMIAEISGRHTFAFYALCMVGQLFWVIFVMFETKGISLEEIQKRMEG